ncbi:nitroreductase family protein [Actinospongicola halichondriae]|uniref:nitroreductase family protein n=1 Tax=Actinospongicola halichondriae TaxID=3236844 RepID=UPI003D4AB3CC
MTGPFDLETVDHLLSTTRAVRKRLDLDKDVPDDVLLDCIRLSQQAPTGSNMQNWRWMIIRDADTRLALAELYRSAGGEYLAAAEATATEGQVKRVMSSANYLAQHLEEVPVHVIPCAKGRLTSDNSVGDWSGMMGSIYPAIWSFQLALRSRGLGSCLTTLHLGKEAEAAEILGIPDGVMQIALLPVAYTQGTDFKPAERPPVERIVHMDHWGNKPE